MKIDEKVLFLFYSTTTPMINVDLNNKLFGFKTMIKNNERTKCNYLS